MSSQFTGQNGPRQNGPVQEDPVQNSPVQPDPGQPGPASNSAPADLGRQSMQPSAFASFGLLLARIVLGGVFIAHGWQKLSGGLGTVQTSFEQMGIPMADISAVGQTFLELGGGALLIVGALTRLVGLLLGASMFAAGWFVHREAFFVTENGFEFVAVLGVFALLFAFVGAGRFSVDGMFWRKRHRA